MYVVFSISRGLEYIQFLYLEKLVTSEMFDHINIPPVNGMRIAKHFNFDIFEKRYSSKTFQLNNKQKTQPKCLQTTYQTLIFT